MEQAPQCTANKNLSSSKSNWKDSNETGMLFFSRHPHHQKVGWESGCLDRGEQWDRRWDGTRSSSPRGAGFHPLPGPDKGETVKYHQTLITYSIVPNRWQGSCSGSLQSCYKYSSEVTLLTTIFYAGWKDNQMDQGRVRAQRSDWVWDLQLGLFQIHSSVRQVSRNQNIQGRLPNQQCWWVICLPQACFFNIFEKTQGSKKLKEISGQNSAKG